MVLPDKLHSQGTHALFIFLEVGHSLNSNSSVSTGIQGGLTEDACRGWAVRKGVQFPSGIVFCSLPCRAASKTIACVLFTHAPILGARPEPAHWGTGGGAGQLHPPMPIFQGKQPGGSLDQLFTLQVHTLGRLDEQRKSPLCAGVGGS